MVIDIRGTTTVNKGALLMLMAVRERLAGLTTLSVAPGRDNYKLRANLGLLQTLHHHRLPRASTTMGNLIPEDLRNRYGLAAERDITGVLDASGFAYSDSFGERRSKREALHGRIWRKRGVPRVLLPQAFGPFASRGVRKWASEVVADSTLVYARDEVSRRHVMDLGARSDVRLAPDITIGLTAPATYPLGGGAIGLLVPNGKMLSTGRADRGEYVALLTSYGMAMESEGLRPVCMIHETTDRTLAEEIAGSRYEVFESEDPLVLKSAIQSAHMVVASRFHAVVSALSQSVPTIALGWSHKYEEIMGQFGVREWAVTPDDGPSEAVSKLAREATSVELILDERHEALVLELENMWDEVRDALALAAES